MQSGRYVSFEEDSFYVPDVWRKQSKDNKQGSDGVLTKDEEDDLLYGMFQHNKHHATTKVSDHIVDLLGGTMSDYGFSDFLNTYQQIGFEIYKYMVQHNVAKEQARFFLPAWCSMYTGMTTMNLRNLIHFLQLRTDSHAQYETQVVANRMLDFVKIHNPIVYEMVFDNV